MNYRFQKFTTIYPVFVKQFLANNRDYKKLSYQQLYDRFVRTRYGLSNFYARHMNSLGNEAEDQFASFEFLQKAWAREHGIKYKKNNWVKDIVSAQVKEFQPDVLYLENLHLFDESFRQQLREVCSKPVFMIGWRFSPTVDFTIFTDLDLIVTGATSFAHKFRQKGAQVSVIPLAFEHTILDEVEQASDRNLDFTFVGSIFIRNGFHLQRYAIVERIMPSTPLQVWSQMEEPLSRSGYIMVKGIYLTNRILERVGISVRQRAKLPLVRGGISWKADPTSPEIKQRYPSRSRGPVFGLDYYEILAKSKIVFNSHGDVAENDVGNMRMYEATGMGACLLTDWKINLPDLFEPDVEVATYRTAEECIEKVRYLLENEKERQTIAAAGQRRTLQDHTYVHRVAKLNEIILEALAK